MASAIDINTLREIIRALLCQHSGAVDEAEIKSMADALGIICTNYSRDEFISIIIRTALEKGDRPVTRIRLDS